jgi:hypothetical protein
MLLDGFGATDVGFEDAVVGEERGDAEVVGRADVVGVKIELLFDLLCVVGFAAGGEDQSEH